jgi:hypothetical protein
MYERKREKGGESVCVCVRNCERERKRGWVERDER